MNGIGIGFAIPSPRGGLGKGFVPSPRGGLGKGLVPSPRGGLGKGLIPSPWGGLGKGLVPSPRGGLGKGSSSIRMVPCTSPNVWHLPGHFPAQPLRNCPFGVHHLSFDCQSAVAGYLQISALFCLTASQTGWFPLRLPLSLACNISFSCSSSLSFISLHTSCLP